MNALINWLDALGKSQLFLLRVIFGPHDLLRRPSLLVQQLFSVGVMSLPIITVAGAFVGMALALNAYNLLVSYNAEEQLGLGVAIAIVRELSPVITGLLFAGRAGSALAAEIGLMKTTEQLSAMEMMAVDPVRRIVAPRFYAGLISMPLLCAIFSMMAIGVTGAHFIGVELLGVENGAYWSQIQSQLDVVDDFLTGMLKAAVFGVVITWIAVWHGHTCTPTAEGVGRATTNTVVISSLAVLSLNFILTALIFMGGA